MEDLKRGARNNADDAATIQSMHDAAAMLGAQCSPQEEEKSADPESLVIYGSEVKSLGDGRIGGYLVRFSSPKDTDLEGDFFSKDTDLGVVDGGNLPVYYHHGMDGVLKARNIGRGFIKLDDTGLWLEAQLSQRDEYEKMIFELAGQGKLGWSSGAAGHLVEREAIGKAYHIKTWVIAEASLTPTPAEPRNSVMPLKSLLGVQSDNPVETESEPEAVKAAASDGDHELESIIRKEIKMEITPEIQELLDQTAVKAAQVGVEEFKKSFPTEDLAKLVVTHDPADNEFKTLAEQCKAIKDAKTTQGRKMDPRLLRIKATGASEDVPSEGGYTLDPTINAELIKMIHEDGPFTRLVKRLPVSTNSNSGWINGVDETSRVAGSRWGGVQGYRLAEGGTPTATKPKFRRINWELKKYGVLMYATDELLADSAQFNVVAKESAMEELVFMANDDIVNGNGLGGPLGIMNAACRVSYLRADATKVQHGDVVGMWQRLYPKFRANAAWFINSDVEPQLDALYFAGTTGVMSPYVSYSVDGVMKMMGRPVYVTEFNPALNAAGDIILADMSQYLFWDKPAEAAISVDYVFPADETVFRFIYRCDGTPAFSSALTPYKGSNTQSPFVSMGAASA